MCERVGLGKPSGWSAPWRWGRLAARAARLWLAGDSKTPGLLCCSYDSVAAGYDEAWTGGMREFTVRMLERMKLPPGGRCVDLTCGTGYVTGWLRARTAGPVTGVDASDGMLAVARVAHPDCEFVRADVLAYLRTLPGQSVDVVTCAWGLGYSRPGEVMRAVARVLRPGGCVGLIDNSLWSLREMVWASVRAFAMEPQSLDHVMRVRFLQSSCRLSRMMRKTGLAVSWCEEGSRTFVMPSGQAAIARLQRTGAAAGFEFAAAPQARERIYRWFAQELERRWGTTIPVTHRYLAATGQKGEA